MLLCAKVTSDGKSEVVFTLKHGDNKQGCAVQPVPGGEVILIIIGQYDDDLCDNMIMLC